MPEKARTPKIFLVIPNMRLVLPSVKAGMSSQILCSNAKATVTICFSTSQKLSCYQDNRYKSRDKFNTEYERRVLLRQLEVVGAT